MKVIKNQEFGGERPLYCEKDLRLEGGVIHSGESGLKETANIEAVGCRFEGKYPLWCCDGFRVKDCIFTVGARAGIWYSRNMLMEDCVVDAPKMFREMDGMTLDVDPDVLDLIVDTAISRKMGARGLRSVMEKSLQQAMFEMPGTGAKKLVLTDEIIRRGLNPLAVSGKKSSKKAGKNVA